MKVRDIMSPTVDSIDAARSISYAAQRMAEDDIGALPVLANGKLVGMITDRDIAVRAVAAGIPSIAAVALIMTDEVATCGPGDDVGSVLALMSREQVRRMPVCNDDEDVIGIVTIADAAKQPSLREQVGETTADICEPSGLHCQARALA